MAKKNLDGYPRDVIGKRISVATHVGPASYSQIVNGSPPTGGDTLQAAEFGLKSFDAVYPMSSDDGQYQAVAIFPAGIGVPSTSCKLEWIINATGAQAGAGAVLSARSLRIMAWGD